MATCTVPVYAPAQCRRTWHCAGVPGTVPAYLALYRRTWHCAGVPGTVPVYPWHCAGVPGTEPVYLGLYRCTWHCAGVPGTVPVHLVLCRIIYLLKADSDLVLKRYYTSVVEYAFIEHI